MDFLLKQRLVGAVVLVALGVIFIPMLLEGPKRTLVPDMEELPEPRDLGLSRPLESFPAPGAVPAEPEQAVVLADPEPEPEPSEPEPDAEPQAEPEAVQPSASAEEPITPPDDRERDAEPGPLGNWVVQVGSFSSEQNALGLREKLRKAGFATQVEKVKVSGSTHFRVRVGPFLERADAEKSQKQLLDKFALKGRVLSYP